MAELLAEDDVLDVVAPAVTRTISNGSQSLSKGAKTANDFKRNLKGIVQVFLKYVKPSGKQPWTKQLPHSSTGSGFICDVKNRMILTNAHCAKHARTILLRKQGDFDKYEARILGITHQTDLAILTVSDERFWNEAEDVEFGSLPQMQQEVDVIGYPRGGDTICITNGVVSRIDWHGYTHSGGERNLTVQIDAAINPGSSGGPALSDGKLIGVAFQGLSGSGSELIGYIIPVPVVRRVLEDFANSCKEMNVALAHPLLPLRQGKVKALEGASECTAFTTWPEKFSNGKTVLPFKGFARFSAEFQESENPYLRLSVSLPLNESGVIIRKVSQVSNLDKVLMKNDVLVSVDGHKIANDGRCCVSSLPPMDFRSIITLKHVGEPLSMKIYRKGKLIEIQTVAENPPRIVPIVDYNRFVPYVMWSGLVFIPFVERRISKGGAWYRRQACQYLELKGREYTDINQQVVIVSAILPHRVSIGYDDSKLEITPATPVYQINGKDIHSLIDVADVIASAKAQSEKWINIEFCNDSVIVLPLKEGMDATLDLQKDFGMEKPFSKDIDKELRARGKSFYE
jgi:S1-C subfamily serine protease